MPMTALVSKALAEYLSRQPDARELLRQAAEERRMRGIASLAGGGASGGASGDA
jgi:hypothetical protein